MNCKRFASLPILIAAFILAICLLYLAGCGSSSSSSNTTAGFSNDTEVANGSVELTAYVDERLKDVHAASGEPLLKDIAERYKTCEGREGVDISFKYVSPAKIAEYAKNGTPTGDMLIGVKSDLETAEEAGTIYGGTAGTSIRYLAAFDTSRLVVARSIDSNAEMPTAGTKDGKDSSGGTVNALQNLGNFKGTIYIPSESTLEGQNTLTVLENAGLYDSSSKTFDASIADKVKICDSSEEVAKSLEKDTKGIGFLFSGDIDSFYPELEEIYKVPGGAGPEFEGASTSNSEHGGVARDFLQYASAQV